VTGVKIFLVGKPTRKQVSSKPPKKKGKIEKKRILLFRRVSFFS